MKKINELKELLFEFTEKFASKTGDYAHITKLTMEMKSHENKITTQFEKLGEYIYENFSNETSITVDDEIKEIRATIDEHRKCMEERLKEISSLKSKEDSPEKSNKEKAEKTDEDSNSSENTEKKEDGEKSGS